MPEPTRRDEIPPGTLYMLILKIDLGEGLLEIALVLTSSPASRALL